MFHLLVQNLQLVKIIDLIFAQGKNLKLTIIALLAVSITVEILVC